VTFGNSEASELRCATFLVWSPAARHMAHSPGKLRPMDLLVGFFWQAADLSEGNDVSQKADDQEPGLAFDGFQHAQAENQANAKVSHNS